MGVRISSNLIAAAFLAVVTILGDMHKVNCIHFAAETLTVLQLREITSRPGLEPKSDPEAGSGSR
jgi:hypothetical protein